MNRPKVGTAVVLMNDNGEILLMRRGPEASHSRNKWSFAGGHLEFGESAMLSAARELHEELGVYPAQLEQFHVGEDLGYDESGTLLTHYITIYFVCTGWTGEPRVMEPKKCSEFAWFTLDSALEQDLMVGCEAALAELR